MNRLNFYRQKRRDGGLRTGIDLNDERVLEIYEPGDSPPDSALLWFVDVRCSGENLPSDPEAIRNWFLGRSDTIRAGLRDLSKELLAGIDADWPIRKVLAAQDAVRIAIYCSVTRRFEGREISEILSDLESKWPEVIRSLGTYVHPVFTNG
jgi:hypothetical protein